jgi:hypothetical protein
MKAAWDIFDYEWMQFDELWKHFQAGDHQRLPLAIRNAMVESAVLHLRIVMEMLEDEPEKPDDYWLTDLIAIADKPAGLPALIDAYNNETTYAPLVVAELGGDPGTNMKKSPRWQINKLMFHPTKKRATEHDWTPILNILGPHLGPVIQDLRSHAVR